MTFSFRQAIDEWGRPSSVVLIERLKVTLTGEAVGWSIWEELKFDEYRRVSGWVLGFDGEGRTAKRYAFYDAALVELLFHHDGRGTAGKQAATTIELHFAPAAVDLDGQHIEAYSVIPWKTDPQTSSRALTKPTDPQPSAHLAALLTAAKLKAEELGTGLLQKVITPAGEVATEFLGVGLAAIARTASLTVGLLLTPTNSRDDPGYASEWELYRRSHGTPLTPAQLRLAQLERLHEQGDLTAEEEAEMIALLASVKGIHIQQLEELNQPSNNTPPTGKHSGRRPKKPEQQLLTNDGEVSAYGKWYYQRPYKFRQGVRDKTWKEAAKKDEQRRVFDPLNSTEIDPQKEWDMGHKPGYEFRKHQKSAAERGIPRKRFIEEHNEHTHYQPELPASNRGHAGEMTTDDYFGH